MANATEKVLVITGGSRGIGAAVARLAARQTDYAIALLYRAESAQASSVVADVERSGRVAKAFAVDVGDSEAVEQTFERISQTLGVPAALVNNAGVTGGPQLILDMTPQTLQRVTASNYFGTAYCIQCAARRMARSRGGQGGAIVNLSSEAARFGGTRLSAYAAAKAAVNTLTIAAARELAEEGIRVNAVSPGVIDTDQHAGQSAERLAGLVASIPIKRMGQPEEVARAVLWLLSDDASYITGSILSITGGR